MYPLKPFLFCVSKIICPQMRCELINLSADAQGEFSCIGDGLLSGKIDPDDQVLLVLELSGVDSLGDLKRLRQVYEDAPILALVPDNSEPQFVSQVIRCGASQVSLLPFSREDFRDAVERIGAQFGHCRSECKVFSIAGAHGGVGATTLSINLAYEFAQTFELDTLLIEMPPAQGVVANWLDLDTNHSIDDLMDLGESFDEYSLKRWLVPLGDRLSILPGCRQRKDHASFDHGLIIKLLSHAKKLADVILLDFQSALPSEVQELYSNSSRQIMIGEQTIPSLHKLKELAVGNDVTCHPLVVINRFDKTFKSLDRARLKQLLGLDYVHTVANDHNAVLAAVNNGQPLRMSSPRSEALADIKRLAKLLLQQSTAQPLSLATECKGGLFHRLLSQL